MSADRIKVLTPPGERDWGTQRFWLWKKLDYVSVLLVALGLIAGIWLIKLATPGFWPKGFQPIPDTMRIFMAQEPGEVDVVMLGTSHVYRGFEPKYFEEETGTSAFALAYPGMTGHEMEKMIDFLVPYVEEKGVKYVILEAREFRGNLTQNIYTDRAVFEHDWQTTKDVWNYSKDAWPNDTEAHRNNRIRYLYRHYKSTAVNFLGVGRLMRYDFSRDMGDPQERKQRLLAVRDELDAGERIVGAYVPRPKNKKKDEPDYNKRWSEYLPGILGQRYEGDSFIGRFKSSMAVITFGNPGEAERELMSKVREANDRFTVTRDKGYAILNGRLAEKNHEAKLEKFTEQMARETITGRQAQLTDTEIVAYNRMFFKIRATGAEPVLIIWPTIAPQWRKRYDSFLNAQADGLLDVKIIDLREQPYVEPFYDMTFWADEGHLNANGAPWAARMTGRAMIDLGLIEDKTK